MLYANDITVLDNFLSSTEHLFILNTTKSNKFPWYRGSILPDNLHEEDLNFNLHFVHKLVTVKHVYDEDELVSHEVTKNSYYYLIEPIINKLQIQNLLRAQINLTPNKGKLIRAGFHVDVPNQFLGKGMTAIYYVNSNDGFTEFENGAIIESVQNRICIFPNNMIHSGVSQTNSPYRLVVNLNWLSKATGRI